MRTAGGVGWYVAALEKYATFGGRSRRREYWFFVLFSAVVALVLSLIDGALNTFDSSTGLSLLGGIYGLAVLVPSIAVSVWRLHDIGRSGWWIIISFVSLIGALILLVFTVQDGTPGSNQYGPNPRAAVA